MTKFYGFNFTNEGCSPEITKRPVIRASHLNFPLSICDIRGKNVRVAHDRVMDAIEGFELDGTLVTGFNAGMVIRAGTFGARDTTYAVKFDEFCDRGGAMHKPLAHASNDPNPALLFTDGGRLARKSGSIGQEYVMKNPTDSFDSVVRLVLLLTGGEPQELEEDVREIISTLGT